ncbi:aminoglycoside 6-adenylyltransferase [Paenibacillus sp. JX-17]|uniref:Aminoglycoside 6-adenylyltransferase n=1 Tax=Paenibacillus lacisoli TaxID=3064525 RepID=A0ABT9CM05_9BACL|nr:aminoglycoside 6-adenylyltransferase [Paenibacillus sp. JX-17]MDO7908638.1 aminoglycoside 6-adenylyltransferase [Paenibacillus sp. JX-17]
MRSEQEMMNLIISVAQQDQRIRAAAMNGSRTNVRAPRDPFQDYDIVYLVTDVRSFVRTPTWIDVFGERVILQTPEDSVIFPADGSSRYPYLMLFQDGNRVDLTLLPITERETYCREDRLTVILLDKDGIMPQLPSPSDLDYQVQRPSAKAFADCCNEFWWVSTYVAKGLWRQEILYAMDSLRYVRDMLIRMMEWRVGVEQHFNVSTGKAGKYLKQYLTENDWHDLLASYPPAEEETIWESLITMAGLFRRTSLWVGEQLGFDYNLDEDNQVTGYLRHIRQLPRDAKEIF